MIEKAKVLVIGLDGAGFALLRPWIDAGDLPNLATLIKEGAHGDLKSSYPPNTGPAWSSIYTGMNVGKHGVYNLVQNVGPSGYVLANAGMRRGRDVWQIIGDLGKSVIVMNAPVTYPPRSVNGIMVTGFPTPSEDCVYTYPPSLKDEILTISPEYRASLPDGFVKNRSKVDLRIYIDLLSKSLNSKRDLAVHFMDKYDWDFFMLVFSETDYVQHYFWADMERRDSAGSDKHKSAIFEVYKQVDNIIGELVKKAGKEAYVFVISDHGAGPCPKLFQTGNFLYRNKWLHFKPSLKTRIKLLSHKIGIDHYTLFGLFRSLGFPNLGILAKRRLRLARYDIDWDKTLAYCFGSSISLNLKGRDSAGIVEPKDYDKLRNQIIQELIKVRDPETSNIVFDKVLKREDVYWGPEVGNAPDIIPITREPYGLSPEDISVKSLFTKSYDRSGDHTMNGLLIIHGPQIKKVEVEKASVIDIAPTILYAMGLPNPSDMDGKILTQAFSESHVKSKHIAYSQTSEKRPKDSVLTDAEEKQIASSLRALGYIE